VPSYSPVKSLTVKNFQSVADATIELGHLTVLVGPGDAGKSAILRAFRALCLNDASDEDIRHGEKQTEVALTLEDGTVIEWWKKQKQGGCYRLGEKEFTKTGGNVPEEIASVLGVGLINIDATSDITPQLSDQFDAPFIIYETGSKRARILGKATRLDTVVTAQMACKKERDQAHREAETASSELDGVEAGLASIPDYEALEARADTVAENLQTIEDSMTLVRRAQELDDLIAEVRSRAVAVDVAPLREQLDLAAAGLERAASVQEITRRLPDAQRSVDELKGRISDNKAALESFEEQYAAACEEAGVCEKCGGLLDHKECA